MYCSKARATLNVTHMTGMWHRSVGNEKMNDKFIAYYVKHCAVKNKQNYINS